MCIQRHICKRAWSIWFCSRKEKYSGCAVLNGPGSEGPTVLLDKLRRVMCVVWRAFVKLSSHGLNTEGLNAASDANLRGCVWKVYVELSDVKLGS